MPGPYRRIDHPNVNSFVVGAVEAPKKPKAAKKAAEKPEKPAEPKPVVVEEAAAPAPVEPTPAA